MTYPPADQPGEFTDPYAGQPYYAPQYSQPQPHYGPLAYPPPQYGPPQSYSGYPVPGGGGWPGGPGRPGGVMAAAVLSFITAGLLILAGLILLAGASAVNDFYDSIDSNDGGLTAEFVFDGIVNFVAAALFISGGVMVNGNNPRGVIHLAIATAVTVAMGVYWIARVPIGEIVVWSVILCAMPIIAVCLIFAQGVSQWLGARSSQP